MNRGYLLYNTKTGPSCKRTSLELLVIPPVTIVRFLIQISRKLYVLLLTVKNRPNLLENVFRSVGSSEVIFLDFLLVPGSHRPRFALSFGKIILSSSTPLQVKYTMNAHLSRVLVYFIWRNPGKEKVFLCLIPLPLISI